ncbi:MAG: Gfo/Idh/MocA family oxidoreductase [Casimicrobiaceae bacterium]
MTKLPMTKLRIGIAGVGIGRQHLAAFRELPDRFDVVALCDPALERRTMVADEFGVARTTASFDQLLPWDDVDVVDICTPQGLHFSQVKAALAAGRHVICEKPIVGSLAACDALIDAERASGKRVMPVYQYRFGAGLQKLLHLIDRGVAGRHYLSTAETTWRRGPAYFETAWRGNLAQAMGGCLLTQAIHAHDALTLALGAVRKVYASIATRVNAVETEDCAVASLTFVDGSVASLAVTLGSADDTSRLRFHFEHLTAQSSLAPYTMTAEPWTWIPASDAAARRIAEALSDFEAKPEGFVGQFQRFHDALARGAEIPVTLADARISLELLTALYHSAATGTQVELPIARTHATYPGWLGPARP